MLYFKIYLVFLGCVFAHLEFFRKTVVVVPISLGNVVRTTRVEVHEILYEYGTMMEESRDYTDG